MAQLFKKNIVKENLQNFEIPDFDKKLEVVKKWHDYYHNGTLKTDKEISVAPGFTEDFLGEILDYIRKPAENHTYDTEYSIAGQRPDFVLGYLNIEKSFIIGELKDAKTSLDAPQKREGSITPVQQAFKYKGGLRDSSFVIVSNFFETRLYYDNHLDYEIWTLDDLVNPKNNYFNFRKFYYLLCEKNLIAKKGDSNTKSLLSLIRIQEKEITKQFYKEYTILRKELFKDIVSNNSFKKSELDFVLNKTQKIIDRIIFIHFCEDLDLLPNGKLNEVVEYGEKSLNTTWETLQNFFRAVDKGSDKLGIPNGYNGGLFHHDEELSNLKVGDKICKKFVELGDYDFEDDLSVNILGHIFEQSISDIEELKDKINKEEEVSLSKRKKDGVFYTPEYIVDYIVKNSVGKKIDDWEAELKEKHKLKEDITDKNYNKRAILVYEELQEKVHKIKVIDPACGSGAFLVKVFDYLLDKNKEIANKIQDLSGSNAMNMFQTEAYFKDILKNNIFGVDLNEESVEISKLSLWLKTASKGKKLANLDGNIKCGNSLIDDTEIAGDKAFVWETEFKDIFDDGGFDVVVGNPPYVRVQNLDYKDIDWFKENKVIAHKRVDISILFFELSQKILKHTGILSFITSNQFQVTEYGEEARRFFVNKFCIRNIIDFGDLPVFSDALTYVSIYIFEKEKPQNFEYKKIVNLDNFSLEIQEKGNIINIKNLSEKPWILKSSLEINLLNSIKKHTALKMIGKCWAGLFTGLDDILMFDINADIDIENEIFLPVIRSNDISKYGNLKFTKKVIYPYKDTEEGTKVMSEEFLKLNFPKAYNYLLLNKEKLFLRKDSRKTFKDRLDWYGLTRYGKYEVFSQMKIISPGEVKEHKFTITSEVSGFSCARVFAITFNDKLYNPKYILSLLNSQLIKYFLRSIAPLKQGGYYTYSSGILDQVPIVDIGKVEQVPFIEKTDFILDKNKELSEKVSKFLKRLNSSFEIDKLSNKLKSFYELEFSEFVKELKKKKVSMSLVEQDEWEEYFDSYKIVILELKSEINKCDDEIDNMVFELYGLSEEERKIVLGNN